MKKFFSLVLAFVMALSLTTVAWAVPDGSEANPWEASTESELTTAVGNGGYIKLTASFSVANKVSITKDTVIDGAGFTLTYTGTDRAITVESGGFDLTITDLDIAFPAASYRERGINYSTNGTLTLTNVTIGSESAYPTYAINLAGASDDATVNISGCAIYGCIALNAWGEDLVVTATNTDFTSVDNSNVENYSAVNLNNNGTKSAENSVITITGGSITAKDENGAPSSATSNGTLTGVIDISGCPSVVGSSKVVVAIITYPGSTNFYSYFSVADATEAALSRGETKIELLETIVNSGETFVPDSSITYVPPAGAELVDDGTGNMMVAPAGTTAGGFGTMFYESDDAATKNWRLVSSFPGATVADFLVEADYDETVRHGNIEYYDVNGVAYVEATKATGAYKLVCGKTEIFLNLASDVDYEFEAEAFTGLTTDEDACGSVLVTKKNLSKTYYTATCEVGKVEYTFYFVADKAGAVDLLVGGKIVKADMIGDDFSGGAGNAFIAHDWVGNDVDAKTKAFTTLKCENCGKVAKLYANADAAGKGAVYEQYGWITAADAGYDVVVPVTPSTDKVQSAETFDAGIAMYVGMSVMAAAGSAVALKKRED